MEVRGQNMLSLRHIRQHHSCVRTSCRNRPDLQTKVRERVPPSHFSFFQSHLHYRPYAYTATILCLQKYHLSSRCRLLPFYFAAVYREASSLEAPAKNRAALPS